MWRISDVGLAKICNRNNIPKPPLGYWTKLAHGHKVEKPELPEVEVEQLIEIKTLSGRLGKEDPTLLERAYEKITFEKLPENQINVPEELSKPHPRIKAMRQELRAAEKSQDGLYRTYYWPGIAVTKPLIPRALLVMDTLFKALEERGYDVYDFKIFDEPVNFQLREHLQSTLTNYAREKRSEPGFYRSTSDYVRIPSGRLQLSIQSPFTYFGDGLQLNWADGKIQRVEILLNSFICGLARRAAVDREKTLERERENREREEKYRQLEEIARRKAMEQARKETLRSDSQSWEQANLLRRFIDAVIKKDGPVQPGSELEKWVAWAKTEADQEDPLSN